MSSSTLPLSATENKRLGRCAREAKKLLAQLITVDHSGKESKSIIRQLRELLPKLAVLSNVHPNLHDIIAAGPDGSGVGMHMQPVSAIWPEYRKRLHDAAIAWLESIARDAEGTRIEEPRLTVNLDQRTATLDGQSYDVNSQQALRWLKVLADRPGEWISSADLHLIDPELDGVRTHRLKKKLPEPIREMIESDTGKGSRRKLA